MQVEIILTLAGSDTGPFNLYSNVDGYTTAVLTGLDRVTLVNGYTASMPDGTTEILLRSTGACQRDLYLDVTGAPTTTTTSTSSTSTTSTTSSTTTPNPYSVTLAEIAFHAGTDGCSLGTILRIFLDVSDYALFVANGNSFAGLGGGAPTTCTAIARDHLGNPITDYLFDNDGICWKITTGNFIYNNHQC
jgi:hypothetical protein